MRVLVLLSVFFLTAGSYAPQRMCKQFLRMQGWEPTAECTVETVTLPDFSDAAGRAYLQMQTENGFDMAPFAGKTADRVTCRLHNHPSGREDVYAHVYLYRRRIIGGDIMTPAVSGFMHGLRRADF